MPPFSPFQSYGTNNQPGQNNSSGGSYSPGNGGVSTMPWGNPNSSSGGNNPWSNWASMMSPSQQGTNGWNQTSPGQWQMYVPGQLGQSSGGYTHQWAGSAPPGSQPFFNIPGMVGQEYQQQQQLYDQNRQDMLGFGQSYFDQMNQNAQGIQNAGQQQFDQGMGSAQMFQDLANQEHSNVQYQNQTFTPFGGGAVDQVNQAAQGFSDFVASEQDRSAERASSAMVGANRAQQSRSQQLSDQFRSMGLDPSQTAMAQQELAAMSSMDRQQILAEYQQQDRQYLSGLEQASAALGMQAGQFAGQMDQANASMRSSYDFANAQGAMAADQFNTSMNNQTRMAYHQMSEQAGQLAFSQYMQSQVTASELQSQGFGAMSQLMQAYPHSSVSFLGSLVSAANLMENTPLGTSDFAQQFMNMQGGQPS